MTPMTTELHTAHHDNALVLTLHGPSTRNSLSEPLIVAATEAIVAAQDDASVRSLVLTGADGHFCAGGNLAGLMARRASGPDAQRRMLDLLHGWVRAMRASSKPIIAAVEGAAAGAGLSLALACDLVVAAEDARFMLSYGRLGLSPDAGATWQLGNAVPRALLNQWTMLAEPITAGQLHGHGLVNEVCVPGTALRSALALAARLQAMAPNALASAKALIAAAPQHALGDQLDAEREHFIANLFHDNAAEGLAAFIEKRPATFR